MRDVADMSPVGLFLHNLVHEPARIALWIVILVGEVMYGCDR